MECTQHESLIVGISHIWPYAYVVHAIVLESSEAPNELSTVLHTAPRIIRYGHMHFKFSSEQIAGIFCRKSLTSYVSKILFIMV